MPYPHPAQAPLSETLSYSDRNKAENAVRLYKRSHLYLPRSSYYLCIFVVLGIIGVGLIIGSCEKTPESLRLTIGFSGLGLTFGLCPAAASWWAYWRDRSKKLLREAGMVLPEDAEMCVAGLCGDYGLRLGKHVCVKKVAEV